MKNMLNYMESYDIYSKFNTNILEDPNRNYDILHEYMKKRKIPFFPVKYVTFHRLFGLRKITG